MTYCLSGKSLRHILQNTEQGPVSQKALSKAVLFTYSSYKKFQVHAFSLYLLTRIAFLTTSNKWIMHGYFSHFQFTMKQFYVLHQKPCLLQVSFLETVEVGGGGGGEGRGDSLMAEACRADLA